MSEVTDALAAGELFEALGQAWSLAPIGPGVRAAFSAWCKLRARKELIAHKPHLDPDDYREQLAVLNEQLAAGAYNWDSPFDPRRMGPGVQAALDQDAGQVHLVALMLEKAHGKLPADRVVRLILEGGEGFGLAWRAAMGLAPNPQAPAPATGPGATDAAPTTA